MKQYTTVYHIEFGKGYILSVKYRRGNNLFFCYFPKAKAYDFTTERELSIGSGNITLKKQIRSSKSSEMSIEDAITSLFSGMG